MNTTIYKIDIFDFLFKFCVLVNSKINCLPLWKTPLQWLRIKKTRKRQLLKWQRKASCIISFSFIITYIKNKNNLKNKENLTSFFSVKIGGGGESAEDWEWSVKMRGTEVSYEIEQNTIVLCASQTSYNILYYCTFLYFFANGTLTFLYRDDGSANFNLFNKK